MLIYSPLVMAIRGFANLYMDDDFLYLWVKLFFFEKSLRELKSRLTFAAASEEKCICKLKKEIT